MADENTFIMLKPDCMKRGLVGEIITRIERKGYRIIDAKMMKLSAAFLYEHYAHIADQPFFLLIPQHMLSGPVFGMIVRARTRSSACAFWRARRNLKKRSRVRSEATTP